MIESEPGSHDWTLALDALIEFRLKRGLAGYRPEALEAADQELGVSLLDAIGDTDLARTALPDLPTVRRVLRRDCRTHGRRSQTLPSIRTASACFLPRFRARR
jgi:hypothetical protein